MQSQTPLQYEISSVIPGVSQDLVWDRINTWGGVNYELGPLVKMSVPSAYPRVSDIPADGECHFTSSILLFGFIPIDAHKFGLRAVDPPNYFDECSENRMMSCWTHKRTITAVDGGVLVTDQCGIEPRFAILGGLLLTVYQFIFRRRHRRLAKFFANQ